MTRVLAVATVFVLLAATALAQFGGAASAARSSFDRIFTMTASLRSCG